MKRLVSLLPAYALAVATGTLLTACGFQILFGSAGGAFLVFAAAAICVLSLPISLLAIAVRGAASPTLAAAILVGCLNGLASSALFALAAGPLAALVMLPSGGIAGAVFWLVQRRTRRIGA